MLFGFEVAQLQNEIDASFGVTEQRQCRAFRLGQREVKMLLVDIKLGLSIKLFNFGAGYQLNTFGAVHC